MLKQNVKKYILKKYKIYVDTISKICYHVIALDRTVYFKTITYIYTSKTIRT